MPSWSVCPANASEKTTTIIQNDFTSYSSELTAQLAQHDACIWALGVSAQGMTEEEYTLITNGYPLAMAHALHNVGVGKDRPSDEPFRFVYISGEFANPMEKSRQMWARIKGCTEKDRVSFSASTSGMKAHSIHPSYFFPSKEFPADPRSTFQDCMDHYILSSTVPTLMPSYISAIKGVALEVAKGRWPDQELFRNKQMRELAREL